MTLDTLEIGKDAIVSSVDCEEKSLRQHIFDMGLTPGTEVTMVKYAPMGDPLEIRLRGYELTIRAADAAQISLENVHDAHEKVRLQVASGVTSHPSIGESRLRPRAAGKVVPAGKPLTFALAGNQNCGKTTLFNQLTGSNQHVGNFPGVTVDRKDGQMRSHPEATVTDLPGIYSLSPYTGEEVVSRQFIIDSKPDAIIDIVDATNIERNLYLTTQLMELDVPMVVALNMMDEVTENGGSVDVNGLESFLGVPVVPISAAKDEGVDELVEHAIHVARYRERPGRIDFCRPDGPDGGAVHRCIHAIGELVSDHAERAGIPVRFAATKLIEGDPIVTKQLSLDENEQEMMEHIVKQMEDERGLDRAAAIADMRFHFIHELTSRTVVKPHESKEHARSRKIDRVLTGKYTGIPMFVLIMIVIFFLTFNVIGAFFQDLIQNGLDALAGVIDAAMTAGHVNGVIHSLVIDGIFTGVGTVLSFIPIIVTLFFFLSLLEDSGYMARVAFVMDKPLRKIGLSGRSIVPMLVGFGCTVPGVMASRTLPSERDRKMTIMLTPFMSCSAKLPIYSFLVSAFFPGNGALAMIIIYFTGILVGILVALISNRTAFKGDAVPFVMELPNYRMPTPKNVGQLLWDKTQDFLKRAFTVIFVATIVIWFLQSFDTHLNLLTDSQNSILAVVAGFISPIFKPCGFADWRVVTALIAGFMAKESIVSTLTVLFGSAAAMTAVLTKLSAASLLVFCLLYTPCVAAISSFKNELGAKWALFEVLFQCAIAWVCATLVFQIGSLFV